MSEVRIKEIVKEQGHTMAWFAEKMGYKSSASLSQMLQRKTMSLKWLEKAAELLQCSVNDLLANDTSQGICPHCGNPISVKVQIE